MHTTQRKELNQQLAGSRQSRQQPGQLVPHPGAATQADQHAASARPTCSSASMSEGLEEWNAPLAMNNTWSVDTLPYLVGTTLPSRMGNRSCTQMHDRREHQSTCQPSVALQLHATGTKTSQAGGWATGTTQEQRRRTRCTPSLLTLLPARNTHRNKQSQSAHDGV